jgi:hypothetical protein
MPIFGEAHLRRILSAYAAYYNQARTHLALKEDAPLHRAVQRSGAIVANPILAELHHQYVPDMIFGKERLLAPLPSKAWRLLASLLSASQSSFVRGNRQPPHGY